MIDQSKAVVPYLRSFSDEEKNLLNVMLKQVAPKATPEEIAVFLYTAQKKGLDPFTRQIYLVPRWDAKAGRETHAVQVSIDGLRLMAQRSGQYAGQTPYEWCGKDGKWVDVWVDEKIMPVAARVGVYRHDFKVPLYSVARFNDYKQTKKDGSLNTFWQKYGPHMIAKCAEALSIRRAFPEETSGFYIAEEMGNAEMVYVQEVAQDASAPVVTGEVVDNRAQATAEKGATNNGSTGVPKTTLTQNKTPEPPENKKNLEEIPSGRKIRQEIASLQIKDKSGVMWGLPDVLRAIYKDQAERFIKLGDELPPDVCKAVAKWIDDLKARRSQNTSGK